MNRNHRYLRITVFLLLSIFWAAFVFTGCGGGGGGYVTPPVVVTPQITDRQPPENSEDVSPDSNISITFSQRMNLTSVQNAFTISPAAAGLFSWSGNTMTYTPSSNLQYSTTYTVTVQSSARNFIGVSIGTPYSWQFTTSDYVDDSAPEVIGCSPVGTSVPTDSVINIAFNKPMNKTATQGAFEIEPDITGTFSWQEYTLIFTPSAAFSHSTIYTVTLSTEVSDSSENNLEQEYSWNFTIVPPPEPDPTVQSKYFGLFIGINDYPSPVNDLSYCVQDAVGLRDALVDSPAWQNNRAVTMLLDSNATKTNIMNSIEIIKQNAVPDDRTVIHFSGHGTNSGDRTYLVVWHNGGVGYISDVEFASWLEDMPCPVVVLIDSCHSGGFIGRATLDSTVRVYTGAPSYDPYYNKGWLDGTARGAADMSGIVWLTASRGDQESHEFSALQHGVFSYYVIQGLGSGSTIGPADTGNDAVSAEEIHNYAGSRTTSYAASKGASQDPQILDNYPTVLDNTEELEIKK
jgi:hypothetical protein